MITTYCNASNQQKEGEHDETTSSNVLRFIRPTALIEIARAYMCNVHHRPFKFWTSGETYKWFSLHQLLNELLFWLLHPTHYENNAINKFGGFSPLDRLPICVREYNLHIAWLCVPAFRSHNNQRDQFNTRTNAFLRLIFSFFFVCFGTMHLLMHRLF